MSWRCLREARRYLLLALGAELAVLAAGGRRFGRLLGGTALASLLFFRDPERRAPERTDLVYATADGVVVGVDRAPEPWLEGVEAVRVSTFLSIHNVHVTRSPVTGSVVRDEDLPGGFAPALFRRAESNRRKRLAIDGRRGRVVVVQVAGLLARRITSWVGVGSPVAAGDRLALIHLGSRTEVLLPAHDAEVLVKVGARVRAGVTPVARYRAEANPA
ncbi:MAG: phosphatidylserine decarboxylase [Actinomycetota bacterium]|nr:phosphatidylserine decarboxylase [Actinomycetota bacterium]